MVGYSIDRKSYVGPIEGRVGMSLVAAAGQPLYTAGCELGGGLCFGALQRAALMNHAPHRE